MLQTGEPLGGGTRGETIWGGGFVDDFNNDLKHDKPYSVSMTYAGPGTKESQSFITTTATPRLGKIREGGRGRLEPGLEFKGERGTLN